MPNLAQKARTHVQKALAKKMTRNVLKLLSGNIAGKAIGLAAIPMLTRIYTPESFGIVAVYLSIVLFCAPLTTLRYEVAIPLPRQDRLAGSILAVSVVCLLLTAVFLSLVLSFVAEEMLSIVAAEELAPYWPLLVLGVVATASYEIVMHWATRKKAFGVLAVSQIEKTISGTVAKIVLGVLGVLGTGLVWGQAVQQGAGILRLISFTARTMPKRSASHMKFAFFRYMDVARYRLPSQLLATFSVQAPLLFSAVLFGASDAGQLSVALMAIALPMSLLGDSVSKAYFGEIASLRGADATRIHALTLGLVRNLLLLSTPPALALLFFGEPLVTLALGADWSMAGHFAAVLSPALVAQFISTPVMHAMSVLNRQRMYLSINIFRTAMVLAVFGCAHYLGLGSMASIQIYSLALAAHYVFTLWRVLKITKAFGQNSRLK